MGTASYVNNRLYRTAGARENGLEYTKPRTDPYSMAFIAVSLDGKQAAGGSDDLIAAMLNVIYTYTAVPEASTWGAMGVLGAAALWHHRRRAAKKK